MRFSQAKKNIILVILFLLFFIATIRYYTDTIIKKVPQLKVVSTKAVPFDGFDGFGVLTKEKFPPTGCVSDFKNCSYTVESLNSKPWIVMLINGKANTAIFQNSYDGDLNGDGISDKIVFLDVRAGDDHRLNMIVLIQNRLGEYDQVANYILDKGEIVKGVSVDNGIITIRSLSEDPDDINSSIYNVYQFKLGADSGPVITLPYDHSQRLIICPSDLKNCSYSISDGSKNWIVGLNDGFYNFPSGVQNYDYDTDGPYWVTFENSYTSDLNGDGLSDKVVILQLNGDGTARWYDMILLTQAGTDAYVPVASYMFNDREEIRGVSIDNGVITVQGIFKQDSDPACCPTLYENLQFKLAKN